MREIRATAAGAVMALYGTMLFFEGELLAPVLIVLFNLLLLLSVERFFEAPSLKRHSSPACCWAFRR